MDGDAQVVQVQNLVATPRYNGRWGRVICGFEGPPSRLGVVLFDGEDELGKGLRLQERNLDFSPPVLIKVDDAAAVAHRAWLVAKAGHIIPDQWPRDVVDACPHCASSVPHTRDVCCALPQATKLPKKHTGELELVTWPFEPQADSPPGAVSFAAEQRHSLRLFEEVYGRDYGAFWKEHACAFRWTCCGCAGNATSRGCFSHTDGGYLSHCRPACNCTVCERGDRPHYRRTAHNCLLAQIPESTAPDDWDTLRGIMWEPRTSTHRLFPPGFRRRVTTFLLCRHAAPPSSAFFRLPPDAEHAIIGFAAGGPRSSATGSDIVAAGRLRKRVGRITFSFER